MIKLEYSLFINVDSACVTAVLMELLLQVDFKFSLGEEKTIVSSTITVLPRVEGNLLVFTYWYQFFSFSFSVR